MSERLFVLCFTLLVFFTALAALTVYKIDSPYTDIVRYQTGKLRDPSAADIETIILGDSSTGNAIDAKLFTELSGQKTRNVSLTGRFGFEGGFNLLRYAVARAPALKNVLFIYTLDIWRRPFDEGAYFETLRYTGSSGGAYSLGASDVGGYFDYMMDLKRVRKFLEAMMRGRQADIGVDPAIDYVPQGIQKISNGLLTVPEDEKLSDEIHPDKKQWFAALADFCYRKNLTCFYLHSPIHTTVFENSSETISNINEVIKNTRGITAFDTVLHYGDAFMGDSTDHIDPSQKHIVTREYYTLINDSLRR